MTARLLLLVENALVLVSNLAELAKLPAAFARSFLRSQSTLVAENLFLRRQIGILLEHGAKPRRPTNGTRVAMV